MFADRAGKLLRLLLFAATLVAVTPPGQARAYQETSPEPTADYPTLEASRDSIGVMIDRIVGTAKKRRDGPIQVSRTRARFKYWYTGDSTDAWVYRW